jgi:hypothetical protein
MAGRATTTISSTAAGRSITTGARPMAREFGGDEAQERQQSNVERDTSGARSSPFAGAIIHEGVKFTYNNVVQLAHRLGRKPTGWMVVRVTGSIYALLTETASDNKTLSLVHLGFGDTTASIMVF